jgi:hypothetical protein
VTLFVYSKMGSNISIVCCARLDGSACCQVEEVEVEDVAASPTDSYQTLLPDT